MVKWTTVVGQGLYWGGGVRLFLCASSWSAVHAYYGIHEEYYYLSTHALGTRHTHITQLVEGENIEDGLYSMFLIFLKRYLDHNELCNIW